MYFSFYLRTVGFYLGRGATWVVGLMDVVFLAWFVLTKLLCVLRTLPMFWWYLGTCSDPKNLLRVNLRFVGFVVFYLCFGGTWVHVVVENDLLGLI